MALPLVHQSTDPLRVVFFGMGGVFSLPPLAALVSASDMEVVAVIAPGEGPQSFRRRAPLPARGLPLLPRSPANIAALAHQEQIPVVEVSRLRDSEVVAAIADFKADVYVVACFPFLFPKELLEQAPMGCLNLHPSLLPRLRGPEPIFWIFREDPEAAGVTVHVMTEAADAGPIVATTPLTLEAGVTASAFELSAARVGGELLVQSLRGLSSGHLSPRSQPHDGSTAPAPSADDWVVEPTWPAVRAYRFIRGVAALGGPLAIRLEDGTVLPVREALGLEPEGGLAQAFERDAERVRVRFSPGIVTVR
jgi:methionyl-tRNA formyltransferase